MSYCRWSSNNFDCDLYCYQSDEGYMTHLAGNRTKGKIPPCPILTGTNSKEFAAAIQAQTDFIRDAERELIDLPNAGESFCDPDFPSFVDRVKSLAALGYHVPPHLISDLEQELKDHPNG